MDKHTPGPWRAEGTVALGHMNVIAPDCDFQQGHLVCSINQLWGDQKGKVGRLPREQTDANAELIASAPRLAADRERLVAAVKEIDRWIGTAATHYPAFLKLSTAVGHAVALVKEIEGGAPDA